MAVPHIETYDVKLSFKPERFTESFYEEAIIDYLVDRFG